MAEKSCETCKFWNDKDTACTNREAMNEHHYTWDEDLGGGIFLSSSGLRCFGTHYEITQIGWDEIDLDIAKMEDY